MNLSKETISTTKYKERVLQFGEGNFLRAFADWIIHKMNQDDIFNGSIVVVQPIEEGLVSTLNEQNGLYTLFLQGINEGKQISSCEVISSISRGINPYTDYNDYLETAKNEDMRFIISNTTESGIYLEPEDDYAGIQKSFPGKLTKWLHYRFKHFEGDINKGMIIVPCELINRNGDKLKEIILKLIDIWKLEDSFKEWIINHNEFCNTLVDRIVPGYPRDHIEEINKKLGYIDRLVVEGEYFHLWVIEAPSWVKKEFPADLINLNVKFVNDMTLYRTRKVRILNGAHTSLVPVSYLYGLRTVRDSVMDESIGQYITDTIFDEIIPTLSLPKAELDNFANAVIDRFKNPYIEHYLISIALNSISKYKTRVLPSLLSYKEDKNELPQKLVFSLAGLIYFYKGNIDGEIIPLNDDKNILDNFNNLWNTYKASQKGSYEIIASTILSNKAYWDIDLTQINGLKELVAHYLEIIDKQGMQKAIKEVL
ncbi:tagaturonate reductase [Vallitalea guaymasensis]|uniref:tagaturonate reductase n=1 Tax=Vallitalea guaymasensis TaxID=1185412 RepID=UPI000DE2AB4D|nr:tagaturonate reductase [Vallitalea guaymasensis]